MSEAGRIVADIGNSRMKWAMFDANGGFRSRANLPVDDPSEWLATMESWDAGPRTSWAIASVHPAAASILQTFLLFRSVDSIRWYRSASDVPLTSLVRNPEQAGADRALAVLAAKAMAREDEPGLVISCGTAITLERVTATGIWEGGAIAPGLAVAASALNQKTAQLPRVDLDRPPPPWGQDTVSAVAAGLFWGTVGAVRELIRRQDDPAFPPRWRLWTGGDASLLAPSIEGEDPGGRIVPDLVLKGLALAAFGIPSEALRP